MLAGGDMTPLFICAQAEAASSATGEHTSRVEESNCASFRITSFHPSRCSSLCRRQSPSALADALEVLAARLIPWRVRWGCARCRLFRPPSRSCRGLSSVRIPLSWPRSSSSSLGLGKDALRISGAMWRVSVGTFVTRGLTAGCKALFAMVEICEESPESENAKQRYDGQTPGKNRECRKPAGPGARSSRGRLSSRVWSRLSSFVTHESHVPAAELRGHPRHRPAEAAANPGCGRNTKARYHRWRRVLRCRPRSPSDSSKNSAR